MSLAPYPSPEARERELEGRVAALAERVPAIEIVEYGHSVEGRPLRAVRIPAPGPGARARVLVCANTHGPEFIGNQVGVGLLAALAGDPPAPLRELHARAEIWLAPCLNPDGYARAYARDGVGSLASLRHNHRGVDLNRNWPLPEGARRLPVPGAGSSTPGDATYRGPHPLSEPETASLDALLTEQRFVASANLHSFMGTLFPPRVRTRADAQRYRRLCAALTGAQVHTRYVRIASRVFDTFTGEQEDHQHHNLSCWAICVECFPLRASFAQSLSTRVRGASSPASLFWRFNPRDPRPWIANDVPGVAAFLLEACSLSAC